MSTQEYNRLRDDAARRALVLRQEAVRAFWNAVVCRLLQFTHKEA